MGLFNKIKNVLFEEEEVVVAESKEPIKKEEKKTTEVKRNVYEEEVSKKEPVLSDRDLFKSDKTFDFPIFDDEEFDDMKNSKPITTFREDPNQNMSINLFDYEKPKIKKEKPIAKTPEIKGRAYEAKKVEKDEKKFHPSPVISPVYGVLDKDYKKPAVIIKEESKKAFDVDDARKKAFGTLEEDIEKTLTKKERFVKPKKTYEEEKSIDDLLEETAFDSIDLSDYEDKKRSYVSEDAISKKERKQLDVLDKKRVKSEEDKIDDDDTLENDLFDLIDSMYENREDE